MLLYSAKKVILQHSKNISKKESMFAEPITEYEIITKIDQLKSNKSAGHDEFNTKLIQTIKQEICKPLTHIFNLTFQSELIPDSLKIVLVHSNL